MQDTTRYAVGIDIGTTAVRCVVAHVDGTTGAATVIGVGEAPNSGMRKGAIANLTGPAQAIDEALGAAERMSGYQVNAATVSINGTHLLSTATDGMIAIGAPDHEITPDDLMRLEEVATVGKVPPNREVLQIVPHAYKLDSQDNIKDPLRMTGTRLEIDANVVSALSPHVNNIAKVAEMIEVRPNRIEPAVLASARAVLTEQQLENGVAVIDIGGATTGLAVFEEGDLHYLAVIPSGGINITNDLAIGLKIDPAIAEKVKLAHAVATPRHDEEGMSVEHDGEIISFSSRDLDEIVEARLEDIFEKVSQELKRAGRAGRLPSGVVLTGGTAHLKGIGDFAKDKLGLAARIGRPAGFGGVADHLEEPQFAAAVGLMLLDIESHSAKTRGRSGSPSRSIGNVRNNLQKFIGKFKV